MNELLNNCYFYWIETPFLLKNDFDVFNDPTDTAYYRDARTHLKIENKPRVGLEENSLTLKMVL